MLIVITDTGTGRNQSTIPANQPNNQPTSQPANPTSHPANPASQPSSQPSQPTSQPTQPTHPANQPTNQPPTHPASQPTPGERQCFPPYARKCLKLVGPDVSRRCFISNMFYRGLCVCANYRDLVFTTCSGSLFWRLAQRATLHHIAGGPFLCIFMCFCGHGEQNVCIFYVRLDYAYDRMLTFLLAR